MALKTIVSFSSTFASNQGDGTLPTEEIAYTLIQLLGKTGVPAMGPKKIDEWSQGLYAQHGRTGVEAILNYAGDTHIQWTVTVEANIQGLATRLSGPNAVLEKETAIRSFCVALNHALHSDTRFRDIRWYDRKSFLRDQGDTWASAPDGIA